MFSLRGLWFFSLLLSTYGRNEISISLTKDFNVKEDSLFIPQIPVECNSLGFCENVSNYPTEYVNGHLLKKLKHKKKYEMKISSCESNQNLTQSVGTAVQLPLCPFIEKEFTPKAAKSDDGKWYFIINKESVFVQKFIAVYCKTLGGCENFIIFSGDYNVGRCLQKNATVKLMAIDYEGQEVQKSFELPSCCSCVASRKMTSH